MTLSKLNPTELKELALDLGIPLPIRIKEKNAIIKHMNGKLDSQNVVTIPPPARMISSF
jgi:hypothetical protein